MKRLLSYYHPKLPLYLLKKLKDLKYDSNAFLEWTVLFPELPTDAKNIVQNKKDKLIIISTYYFVLMYILACLVIVFIVPLAGIMACLFSPLIVLGYIYCLAYTLGIRNKTWRQQWEELSGVKLKPKENDSKVVKNKK